MAAAGAAAAISGGRALVWGGGLPGGSRLRSALGACDVGGGAPQIEPVPLRIGTFHSAFRRREVGYAVVAPRAASDLPICLYLHGRGGSHADVAGRGVGLPWHLAALIADSAAPFAEATRAYLAGAPPSVTGAVTAGCHDGDFWRSVAGAHLARIGAAFAA